MQFKNKIIGLKAERIVDKDQGSGGGRGAQPGVRAKGWSMGELGGVGACQVVGGC